MTQYGTDLKIEDRVRLLAQICEAVGYAHNVGIVHRDLKPGNVLVDPDGQCKVLDFGIALDTQIDERTMMTQTGQLLGTLQYMAPEQIDGGSNRSNTRTDVYALGLIGYELLSGTNPQGSNTMGMYEMIRSIRDHEPDTLGTIDRSLRGDIETIIAKALDRDPDRRYEHANAFGDDLNRYLMDQPILARKASTWYQLRKFSKRNPALVSLVIIVFVVLVSAVIMTNFALREANKEREIAQTQQRAQELTALFVTEDLFSAGNPDFGGDSGISLLDAMRSASDTIPDRFEGAPEAEASISFTMGDQFRLMNDFEKARFHLERSVELSHELPDLHIDVLLHRYNSLIDLYNDIDDLDLALEYILKARELMDAHPEVSHLIHIDTLVQHASLMYYIRDIEQSSEIFQQAYDLGEIHAPMYNGTVDAATALAMVYTNLERFDEAQTMHERGIELRMEINGPENPATLQAKDNFAIQLIRVEKHDQALALLNDVLETRLRVFGEDHNKTLLTYTLIGRVHSVLEEYELAEELLLRSYQGLVDLLGVDHRYTKVAKDYLYTLYTRWEKPDLQAQYAPDK